MIQNYIKVALRNIKWQKSFSFINIAGLAIGMAVCILILLYVREEITYDVHHEYKDRIYRIQRYYIGSDGSIRWKLPTLAPSFVPLLENDFPEMEHRILKFWEEKDILTKYITRNKGKKKWSFQDGPITANNPIFAFITPLLSYRSVFNNATLFQAAKP